MKYLIGLRGIISSSWVIAEQYQIVFYAKRKALKFVG
jgi:hypothetical protein